MKAIQRSMEERLLSVQIATTLTKALLFFLPLIYIGNFTSTYASLRYFTFGTIALVLLVTTAWTWMQAMWIPKALFRNWYGYGLIAFFAAFLIVSLTSIDRATSFFSSFQLTDGVFALLYVTIFALNVYTLIAIRGKETFFSFLNASVWGAVLLSILIMLSPDGVGTLFASARGGATTGNSSIAATYILFHIFFAILLFFKSETRRSKTLKGASVLILACSPIFLNWHAISGSSAYTGVTSLIGSGRGAFIGVVYGLVVAITVWLIFQKHTIKKYIGIAMASIIILATIVLAAQLLNPSSTIHRQFIETASETRLIFWDIALKAFKERPLIGWGPGSFDNVYHTFFNPHMLHLPYGGEMWVGRSHNIFFETLVSGGILLMSALVFFLISLVAGIVRATKRAAMTPLEASPLIGALLGWLFQAQFIFESILSLAMIGMLAGVAYALSIHKEKAGGSSFHMSRMKKMTFFGVACLALVLFVYTIAQPFKKDRTMHAVYTTTLPARATMWNKLSGISPMGDDYDSVWIFNRIQKKYNEEAKKIAVGDPKLKEAAVKELESVGNYLYTLSQSKEYYYGHALIGAQIYYTRMRIENKVSEIDLNRARFLAREAMKLSPTDPQPYWVAGQIEMAVGNMKEAKNIFEQALLIDPTLSNTHRFILQLATVTKDQAYYNLAYARAKQNIPNFDPNF
jgi:O-antigen ligase